MKRFLKIVLVTALIILSMIISITVLVCLPIADAESWPQDGKKLDTSQFVIPTDARQFTIKPTNVTLLINCKEFPNRWKCTTRDGRRFDIMKTAEEMKRD